MELRVPEARLFSVEYPGYVQHEDGVLESLGGLDGIARQLQDNAGVLPLCFRQDDPYAHPVYGDQHKTKCLLVKLTSRARRGPPAATPSGGEAGGGQAGPSAAQQAQVTAEAVARVERVYRFSSPADYQYVSLDTRASACAPLTPATLDPPGFAPQPLLCMPPLFAKQPIFDYAFKGHTSNAPATDTHVPGKKRPGLNQVNFYDAEVPRAPIAPITVPEALQPLLEALQELLRQRPMWVDGVLAEALPAPYTPAQAQVLLPKLCYRFKSGPWRHAWVRRGYDPRRLPRARIYQVLNYHLPTEWHAKIQEHMKSPAAAAAKAAAEEGAAEGGAEGEPPSTATAAAAAVLPPTTSSYSKLLRFEAVPDKQSCHLPVFAIRDVRIQEILRVPANHSEEYCSDVSGWLTNAAWEAIRNRVKERFQAVLDGLPLAADEDAAASWMDLDEAWPEEEAQQPQHAQQAQAAKRQPAGEGGGAPVDGVADGTKLEAAARHDVAGTSPEGGAPAGEELAQHAQQMSLGGKKAGSKGAKNEAGGRGGKSAKAKGRGAKEAAAAAAAAAAAEAEPGNAPEGQADAEMREAEEEPELGPAAVAVPSAAAPPTAAAQQPTAGARAAGAAAGAGTAAWPEPRETGGEPGLLPQGLLASLQDYLAHMPDQGEHDAYELLEDEDEDEEERRGPSVAPFAGYNTEGYATEDGGYQTDELGGLTEEEDDE